MILPEELPESFLVAGLPETAAAGSYHAQVAGLKRSIVEQALLEAEGNHAEAARSLNVSPSYFRRLARDLSVVLP